MACLPSTHHRCCTSDEKPIKPDESRLVKTLSYQSCYRTVSQTTDCHSLQQVDDRVLVSLRLVQHIRYIILYLVRFVVEIQN